MSSSSLLSVFNVTVTYGPIAAVHDVSLDVWSGEVVVLAGANGAGKTSLLRAVAGVTPVAAGRVAFAGTDLTGLPADRIAALGLRMVPEGRRLWPTLTVKEHLEIAWRDVPAARRAALAADLDRLFPRLAERRQQRAGSLSGGEQQMLAIARGLAADPKLLIIDELSLGLAPGVVRQLFDALRQISAAGVTLLIVEQALRQALAIAHRGYVLETGRLVVEGTAAELADNEAVRRAYLTV